MNTTLTPSDVHLLKQAIRYLATIPHRRWCRGQYHDDDSDKRCAVGHLNPCYSGASPFNEEQAQQIEDAIERVCDDRVDFPWANLEGVNDDGNTGRGPKANTMGFLRRTLKGARQ